MKNQDDLKTKEDILEFIGWYISYRGGMGNRIDAFDIEDFLKGKRRREYKQIKKHWKETTTKQNANLGGEDE